MIYPKYDRVLVPGEGRSSRAIKEKVVLVGRVLAEGGILPYPFGHCSARIPGGNRIYIMPHTHWQRKVIQELTADDICTMDLDGNPLDCDSIDIPEERYFHIEVYKARPDVGAVIYGHPRLSSAFADAGRDTLSVYGSKVNIIPYPGFGHLSDRGKAIAEGLGKNRAVVWSGGNVVVGKDIEEACVTAFALEREAERQLFVILLGGTPQRRSDEDIPPTPEVLRRREMVMSLSFQYYEAMDKGPRREVQGRLFWP